ncbi:MAG: hypothetical protein J0H74_04120 [Chitinophagaceae bacterium]|nr:hypothetical protein [Chitinophagaceae bacterium]
MSFFIFAKSLVQRVYYLDSIVYSCGSKSLSVKSQFFRIHRTNDFPLLFYPSILVDVVQLQEILYSGIQQAGYVMVLLPYCQPGVKALQLLHVFRLHIPEISRGKLFCGYQFLDIGNLFFHLRNLG